MDKNSDDEFHKAVASNDWKTLRTFLKKWVYDDKYIVDQLITKKWSLTDVVGLGKLGLTKLFLEMNDTVSVQDVDRQGWTGLHQAAIFSDVDQVKFLLERNADPNSMDELDHTPLYSSYDEHGDDDHDQILEIIKILIDAGATAITTRDNINYLQIESALLDGNLEVVEFVLNLNIDLRAHYGSSGNTVLHSLARNHHEEIMKKVLHIKDLDVDVCNNGGETPLHLAVLDVVVDAVEFLLDKGAYVNAASNYNWTPLWTVINDCKYNRDIGDGQIQCIQILLQRGADIQVINTINDSLTTIFDTIFEFEDKENKWTLYRLLVEHLALQEANGVRIVEIIQNKIDLIKEYFDFCKELLLMKIYESKTLFDALTCSGEKMVTYMRNVYFARAMNYCCIKLKLHPICYGNILQERCDKANRTVTLRNLAAIVICKLMKINYNGYSFLVDTILSYLEDKDMDMLLSISHEIV